MKQKDKVSIITAATKGIGAVCAKVFAQEGLKVVGVGRTPDMGEQDVAEIQAEGGESLIDRKYIIALGLLENVSQDIAGIPSNILAINILIESNYGI